MMTYTAENIMEYLQVVSVRPSVHLVTAEKSSFSNGEKEKQKERKNFDYFTLLCIIFLFVSRISVSQREH